MTPVQHLVNRIGEFVHGFSQQATPASQEMARQFAEACRAFNDRLLKCLDYLGKGMRSEAVQEALASPSVFDLAETLNFAEWKEWTNLCLDLKMTPPPALDLEAVGRLKAECGTEQLLEPLLREFRRLVHSGGREERIAILRRIRRHDADNPVWFENLEPLEREQLTELERRADQAMAADDAETASDLLGEMTDPHRVVPAPPETVTRVEQWLRGRREAAATAEAEALLAEMTPKFEGRDYDGLAPLLQRWKRLARFAEFQPAAGGVAAVAKIQQWHDEETRRRQLDIEFAGGLRRLHAILGRPPEGREGLDELEGAWHQLRSLGRPLPPDAEAAVTQTAAALRQALARRRRAILVSRALAGLALLAGIGVAGWLGWNALRFRQSQRELAGLLSRQRYEDMQAALDGLRTRQPGLYARPEIQYYVAELDRAVTAQSEHAARFTAAMAELEKLQAGNYPLPRAQTAQVVAAAEALAETAEEKDKVQAWRRLWEAWEVSLRERRDADFARVLDTLESRLAAARANPDPDPAADLRRFGELAGERDAAANSATLVSPELRQRWTTLANEMETWRAAIEARRNALDKAAARRIEALRALDATVADPPAYRKALEQFVADFPEAPEAADFRRALAQFPAWSDAVGLAGVRLTEFPRSAEDANRLDALLVGLPGGQQSVWRQDVAALRDYAKSQDELRRQTVRLRQFDFFDLKRLQVRRKGAKEWQPVYFPENLYIREETADGVAAVTTYWGKAYTPSAELFVPKLEHFSVKTSEYDVEGAAVAEQNLVEEARFLREFLAGLPDDRPLDLVFLDALTAVGGRGLHPVPTARIMKTLVEITAAASPLAAAEIPDLIAFFRTVNPDVPWYNTANPRVRELTEGLRTQLGQLPDVAGIRRRIELHRWLLLRSLQRQVQAVGRISRDARTGVLGAVFAVPGTADAWAVLPGAEGVANAFYVAARRRADGTHELDPEMAGRLYNGQMLFAPADGKDTAAVLAESPVETNGIAIPWPACWPVNERQ